MKFPIYELPRERFPAKLLEIPDPPERLFVRGTLPAAHTRVLAVVGARAFSGYGQSICEQLIAGLSGHDIVIVSGLALGVDSIAHEAALKVKLPTIAIPGSGLNPDVIYPVSRRDLAEKILEAGGGLLSEFEPDFQSIPTAFPQRNRIMAGLSDATLIIECESKSGTMITARLATDYNREVLAVPGNIMSKNSEGPHQLLKLGATLISNSKDILEVLGLQSDANLNPQRYSDCSLEELKIIELLKTPLSRDDLLEKLSISTSQANSLLTILELKDLIKESGGEIFLR
jgi:DNA processing protein